MNYPTFQKVIDDLDKSYKANQGFANRWNPYDLGKFTVCLLYTSPSPRD